MPTVCVNGTYCPKGSISPTLCSPGFYCTAKSEKQIPCPAGFYCPGRSEYMYKCANGTYCPPQSASPTKCPSGSFGTGVSENHNVTIACQSCGRGMYSSQDTGSGLCFDCTPGYVCLGSTNSATPTVKERDNGFMCPPGHYCPLASYEATKCPVGTFNMHTGGASLQDCVPCKEGYYNNLVG